MKLLYDLSRSMALSEGLLCCFGLKASNICWKSLQILKDVGRSGEEILGLGAELLHFTAHGEVSSGFDPLQ